MIKKIKRFFRRNGSDHLITICVIFLAVFGVMMIGSAAIGMTAKYGDTFAVTMMKNQAIYSTAGIFLMLILTRIYKSFWVNKITCTIVFLIGIFSMIICPYFNSKPERITYAWIEFKGLSIQPSEFMKIALIIIMAYCFSDLIKKMPTPRNLNDEEKTKFILKKIGVCIGIPAFLIMLTFIVGWQVQRDLGSTLVIIIACGSIFLSTRNKFYLPFKKLAFILAGVLIVIIMLKIKPYQADRFVAYLSPLSDTDGISYQLINSLVAFSGGLIGKGFGKSTLKYGYIPEAYNDFIFAIIFEELGIIGMLCVFVPTLYIIFKLFYYSTKIKDERDRLILIGLASYFFAHFFINVGGITGFIPMTGIPLLLVSAGGSSAVACLIGIGVAQSIICKYHRNMKKEQL